MLRTEREPAVRVVSSRCVVRACVHAVSPVAFPHGFRMGGQHDATATGENSSTFTVITRGPSSGRRRRDRCCTPAGYPIYSSTSGPSCLSYVTCKNERRDDDRAIKPAEMRKEAAQCTLLCMRRCACERNCYDSRE